MVHSTNSSMPLYFNHVWMFQAVFLIWMFPTATFGQFGQYKLLLFWEWLAFWTHISSNPSHYIIFYKFCIPFLFAHCTSINNQWLRFWSAYHLHTFHNPKQIALESNSPKHLSRKRFNQMFSRAFIAADVDLDGKIGSAEFDMMIESAAGLPRKFGYNW